MRFYNKVALVTGAGSGIGLATAHRLANEKAKVVAAVFDEAQRNEVSDLDVVILDVRSEKMWDHVIAHLERKYYGLDIQIAVRLNGRWPKHPIGRIATPDEIAAVIAFLASDDASFMTGLAVPIDGGRSVRF